ncbi:MAG: Serine/threonine-protein kinase PknD [Anaerolineae bacterium]|nr:Serine/threonine-protein kinase PknD [Anaerolineae bacterium]
MPEQLGRYQIAETIGAGGFAIVYRGHDTALDRPVALKELRPVLLQDKNWVQRFQREARTIARLDHQHIVPIFDVHHFNDRLFIVMRLVEGGSLEDLLVQQGPLPWDKVLEIITPIGQGLNYAHTNGVLHRDLKPANILIDAERGPMLSDFGLAKLLGEHSVSLTESGSIVGTPHYIAPEVWEGKGTTTQSDIYALGCILYEMITGEKIFKGETPPAVMMAHFKPLTLPAAWPAGVPAQISTVLKMALAQTPAERYLAATDMVAALHAISNGQPLPAVPSVVELPPPAPEPTPVTPMPAPPPVEPSLPTPTPLPAPVAAHRRGGCLTKATLITLALMVAIIIGVGSFCAAIGGSLGSNITSPLQTLSNLAASNIQISQPITETITIPVPAGEGAPRLEIEVAADKFTINSGITDALLQGTAVYNVALLKPKVVTTGQTLRLTHEGTSTDLFTLMVYDFIRTDIINQWELTLGTTPMVLLLSAGTAQGQVTLDEYAITDLTVTQGAASELDILFNQPNRVEMNTFEFNAGPIRRAALAKLANTRARRLNFTAATGDYTLDFSGELQNDMEVKMQGSASGVSLLVPAGVSARVIPDPEASLIDAAGSWQKSGREYVLAGSGPTLVINMSELNIEGTLKLRN